MARIHTAEPVPARYRKKAIPQAVRRGVAVKYGCPPGGIVRVPCYHCGAIGRIWWHRLQSGRPSAWVTFEHELDHLHPEFHGGEAVVENVVLACQRCNRRKGASIASGRTEPEAAL